ncbi:MAG: single-stranded DNA-binding protein [Vicinamibacterales bacterium]
MSRGVNVVHLLGNVGNDPEVRATSTGSRVAKVSLATNRTWKDRTGQDQEATDWHSLVFWGRLCDVVEQYVKKGDRLYVEGRIEYRRSEGESGIRFFTDVVVSELVMLGTSSGAVRASEAAEPEEDLPPTRKPAARAVDTDSDIPF